MVILALVPGIKYKPIKKTKKKPLRIQNLSKSKSKSKLKVLKMTPRERNKYEAMKSYRRIKCPFYMKTGVCKYGDNCVRRHPRIIIGHTLLLSNIYQPPPPPDHHVDHHFQEFYDDLYAKLSKYGNIKDVVVCDNLTPYMAGHAYVKYQTKKQAYIAKTNLRGSYHAGRPIVVNFSPVRDLRGFLCPHIARFGNCHIYRMWCPFMHLKDTHRAIPTKNGRTCCVPNSGGVVADMAYGDYVNNIE